MTQRTLVILRCSREFVSLLFFFLKKFLISLFLAAVVCDGNCRTCLVEEELSWDEKIEEKRDF